MASPTKFCIYNYSPTYVICRKKIDSLAGHTSQNFYIKPYLQNSCVSCEVTYALLYVTDMPRYFSETWIFCIFLKEFFLGEHPSILHDTILRFTVGSSIFLYNPFSIKKMLSESHVRNRRMCLQRAAYKFHFVLLYVKPVTKYNV